MDFGELLTAILHNEVTPVVIVTLVVIAIISGLLVPRWVLKRYITIAEEYRKASDKKDAVIQRQADVITGLVAGVRIADKFYKDFVPPIDEITRSREEVNNAISQGT